MITATLKEQKQKETTKFRGSNLRGVSRNKRKWQMMVMVNQNNIYLGGIETE